MVELFSEQNVILKNNGHDTRILMLQGRPIKEPIERYGPFVMNTRSEIQEAFWTTTEQDLVDGSGQIQVPFMENIKDDLRN